MQKQSSDPASVSDLRAEIAIMETWRHWVRSQLAALARFAYLCWRSHRTRQTLTELDSHLLKDIGVAPLDARNEANRPFWHL